MSQNDTLKWLVALSLLTSSSAFAQSAQSFRDCVDGQLKQMGVDPAMQNRWNANTIAGKLQIHAIRICEGLVKMSQKETSGKVQNVNAVVPVSTEVEGAAGMREI